MLLQSINGLTLLETPKSIYRISMPRLPDQEDNVVTRVRDRFKEAWDGFWDFALRDNVLEVAIGLMYMQIASTYSLMSWYVHI